MTSSIRILVASVMLIMGGILLALNLNSTPKPADRTYVGQQSCMTAGCHEDSYGANSDYKGAHEFQQTMHQKIHLRPTPESVVLDRMFEKDTIIQDTWGEVRNEERDTLKIRLYKSADRKDYMIQMFWSGGGDSLPPLKVAYTYGGNGWIQRYLMEVDGRYFPTPFQYVLPAYRDRSSYGGVFYFLDIQRYWAEIDPNTFEAKFYEWNTKKFKNLSWDRNCAACHLNGFDLKTKIDGTDTLTAATWVGREEGDSAKTDQNILIGCESCHGPGSEHVANPTVDNIVAPNSQAQFPRTFAGTELKMDLCNVCHDRFRSTGEVYNYAYDDANKKPFMPGEPLALYQKDSLTGMNRWADRTTSYAHHQTGQDFKRSKPYLQHVFKNGCWSCHTVHHDKEGLPYQLDRDWYTLQKGEGCVAYGCHDTMANVGYSPIVEDTVNLHTLHSAEVSQCVNCHFTKTASIGFAEIPGKKPLYEFSSHDFKVIRPTATKFFNTGIGMMNTCAASCHRNGRGSRNFSDTAKVAPDYGIVDKDLGFWKSQQDYDLADSLWFHYKRLWPGYTLGSSVKGSDEGIGSKSAVTATVPNPFTSSTMIRFAIAAPGEMILEIYDINGRLVKTIAAGRFERGSYTQTWDGIDELGGMVGSGTYIVRLTANGTVSTKKLVLIR